MSPRILFVNHTGELGGAELTLLPIAHRYRDRCAVVLLKDGPLRLRLEELGVQVILLPGGEGMLGVKRQGSGLRALASAPAVLGAVWRLARLARGFDVIYANTQKSAIVSFLAGMLTGTPVVWYLHDIMSAQHFGGVQRKGVVAVAIQRYEMHTEKPKGDGSVQRVELVTLSRDTWVHPKDTWLLRETVTESLDYQIDGRVVAHQEHRSEGAQRH